MENGDIDDTDIILQWNNSESAHFTLYDAPYTL